MVGESEHRRELRLASTSPPRSDGSSRNFYRNGSFLGAWRGREEAGFFMGNFGAGKVAGGATGENEDKQRKEDVAPGHLRQFRGEFLEFPKG